MGDSQDQPIEWLFDDVDWVQLFALAPNLWYSYLADLRRDLNPAAAARFFDRCYRSLHCLTDLHARLPGIGMTLAAFAELHAAAWAAQFDATTHEEDPVADDETVVGWGEEHRYKGGRLDERREGWQPDLNAVLADKMREAVIILHLRGLDDDRIACAMGIPGNWPALIVGKADLNPKARAVIRAHLEGKSLGAIAKATGVPASTALRILRRISEVPNGAKVRVDARDRARTIVKLRERGYSYKEIAERADCSMDVVKNVLRRKRRPRYGGGAGRVSE